MCGIAGFFGMQDIAPARLQHCLAMMQHRGPDGRGVFQARTAGGQHVVLLHTRLAIVDLDPRSDQPFRQGALSLAFNGEIYNYLELKPQLENGKPYRSSGDTEVLARLLEEKWAGGLDLAEGMWALAVWDERQERLLLSRDRFGEKPLYLMRRPEGLYFASEIKFLLALSGIRPAANTRQLYRYLVNGYKALYKQNETFYEGVVELPRAACLEISADGAEHETRYWDATRFGIDETMSYQQAVAGARDALIRSVGLRLRADVPLAFCLSGGVDSNAIIAIAKKVYDHQVHGFTIMNTDARYEERKMVETSVKELGLRHTAIPVERRNFLANLRKQVAQHDGPVCTITYYLQWQLMESIHNAGYKVSVSGTAADELFSGYYDHHMFYLSEVAPDCALYREALGNWRKHVASEVRNPYLKDPERFVRDPSERRHIFLDADAFAEFLIEDWNEPFSEERYSPHVLRNRMLNELFHEAVPPILHEDDHNAMSFSIENRSPFLDRNLYEFMQRTPTRHLVRNGRAKAVLRDAVRGIAPEEVVDNPRKVGFNAPITDLLNVQDNDTRSYLLDDSPIFDHVRKERIEELLAPGELPNSRSKFLFYFLNAKMFLEEADRPVERAA
jgi:asparagine synthase (glutamine-hydrolysing)